MKAIQNDGSVRDEVVLTGSNVQLLNAVTATGAGTPVQTGYFTDYSFEVFGTASSFSLQIQAVGPSNTPYSLKVFDEIAQAFVSGNIIADGIYSVSVPKQMSIQANVVSITGGNLSVAGGMR